MTAAGLRLNLGCGAKKRDGWVNVDRSPQCQPDMVVDLEAIPWPWPDNSVAEVIAVHVLEHLGREPDSFIAIMGELHRVCAHGAQIHIVVPHPRHTDYLNDPTHVRPITPETLQMFSRKANDRWAEKGWSNTPLAIYTGIDFDLLDVGVGLDARWQAKLDRGEVTWADIEEAHLERNNVVKEYRIRLQAVKEQPQP